MLFWILVADPPLQPCAGKWEIVVLLCTRLVLCLWLRTRRVCFFLFLFAGFKLGCCRLGHSGWRATS